MTRYIVSFCAVILLASIGSAHVQTTVWGGDFPNNKFSVASNWVGGVAPLNDGTAIVEFTTDSNRHLKLDLPVFLSGLLADGANYGSQTFNIIGSSSLTLGSDGIDAYGYSGYYSSLNLLVPLTLAADQTWLQLNNGGGFVAAYGTISGSHSLTLVGDDERLQFILGSSSSTFSGGVTVTGHGTTLAIGGSSTGPAGAPTAGPVGTGTLALGDGTRLTTNSPSAMTLANAIVVGDRSNGYAIRFGGSIYSGDTSTSLLTLTGPITLNDDDLTIKIARNSIITVAGNITGYAPGVCLDLTSSSHGNSYVVFQGNVTNVDRIDLDRQVSLILDGTGPSQVGSITDLESSSSNTYLGLGRGYAGTGNVGTFLSFMSESGSAANFAGSLGFDTTSGTTVVFNEPIYLTAFNNSNFVGLGSATRAILGPAATITPQGGSSTYYYAFGGGGGTLTVQSALDDGDSEGRELDLNSGNAPLTLILSGALSYTGSTYVDGGALIFDTPPSPDGGLYLYSGYIGSTANSGFSDANTNVQAFIDSIYFDAYEAVVGFDALSGTRTITSNIDMRGTDSGIFLGTATSVNYTGIITPYNDTYKFSGVKGGSVLVSSALTDTFVEEGPSSRSVVIGLTSPIESLNFDYGFVTQSSVTLAGINTYSGGTTLNSGYLFVTNSQSLGSGELDVPSNASTGWAATLAASGAPVSLPNDIYLGYAGLALNTNSSQLLTLTGNIYDYSEEDGGNLGIFGPVDIEGNNSYSGTTTVNGATVTIGSPMGFGYSSVQAFSSTLNFTSLSTDPGVSIDGFELSNSTATFAGSPQLSWVTMSAGSILNFNGATADIWGLRDAPSSNSVINLATNTVLTIEPYSADEGGGTTFHGSINGSGSIVITAADGESLNLSGASTYTQGTTINPGAIVIASNNSALGTGTVTVNGALLTNSGVTLTNSLTLGSTGGLAGYGTFSPGGTLAIQGGAYIDPGRANISTGAGDQIPFTGTLAIGGATTLQFGSGGSYIFALSDASGAAGTGYSTISAGALTFNYTGTPFDIQLYTFDPGTNAPGTAFYFNASSSYSWTLVSATSITGFNANYFTIDTSNFQNDTGIGHFFVSQSGNNLMLNFTPVPEPSTWAMLAVGLLTLGTAYRRRR